MSENPVTDSDSDPTLSCLDPESLQRRIGWLIRRYLHARSADVAQAIVRHINGLCAHPRFNPAIEERCVYRRMARDWSVLAMQD